VTIPLRVVCVFCNGHGSTDRVPCDVCAGRGVLPANFCANCGRLWDFDNARDERIFGHDCEVLSCCLLYTSDAADDIL
jgi:hypothetical protein